MPTPMDAMLGLVVAAIGLLTVVVSFQLMDAKKKVIAYVLSGLIVVTGLFYFVSSQMRGASMRKRISNIQRQQQVNLDQIQKRLRDTRAQNQAAPKK